MKPRSDVVIRRFLAGESIDWLVYYMVKDCHMSETDAKDHANSCIRRALGRKGKR